MSEINETEDIKELVRAASISFPPSQIAEAQFTWWRWKHQQTPKYAKVKLIRRGGETQTTGWDVVAWVEKG